jgi:hypothetical protein
VASANAGTIYCRDEVLPDGRIAHAFTNTNVNPDKYPIVLDYGDKSSENETSGDPRIDALNKLADRAERMLKEKAQLNRGPEDLEKKRLEERLEKCGNWKECKEINQTKLESLDKDPEQYFYNKSQTPPPPPIVNVHPW